MALGFFKKVFSFGKKEVVEEPAADEPLKPIDFSALEALARGAEQAAPAPEAAPETPSSVPTPEIEPEPAPTVPAPGPETPPPAPAPEIQPEPVPPAPAPVPQEVPPSVPERPVEIPHEPAHPQPVPEVPEPATPPEIEPAVPPAPEPAPQEVPAPERTVEIPHEPATPLTPEPAPVEVPPTAMPPSLGEEVPAERAQGFAPSADAGTIAAAGQAAAPSAAEAIPSAAPAAEYLPLEGGEDVGRRTAPGKVTVTKRVEQKAEPQPAAMAPAPRASWIQRLRDGLSRSSRELTDNIAGVFTKRRLDEETLQDLEDVLIRADLGVETALRITDALSSGRYGKQVSDAEVRAVMAEEIAKVLKPVALPLELDLSHKPHVILVVGVNGTGKTTTIGKLAAKLSEGGLSVMLAAGDTFRAAAIEQLKIWGERTRAPVISSKLGADAAGLAYDAFEKAKAAGSDVLIIDTAGRLQNRAELMAELEKIVRVLAKLDPDAPHTVLQTVDATTGQNAMNQVEIFRNVAGVNGLVMTKLDGTARGGILVGIAAKYKLPVYFIGVGEQVDDLEPFSAGDFARAIAGVG